MASFVPIAEGVSVFGAESIALSDKYYVGRGVSAKGLVQNLSRLLMIEKG